MVDTHAHIYHVDEAAYPMIDDPYRPEEGQGTLEHLRSEVRANGIEKVVLVQTGSAYRWDNRLLADTAAANSDWTVGVCTLSVIRAMPRARDARRANRQPRDNTVPYVR